ncbi:MAG: dihydrofolate reductase family protein [Acidimicrobiales bacterium]|nr:dihydrofolate reductase family protein [Acidimicrobiales bacterium]
MSTTDMGKVVAGFSMSLDGFIADPEDGVPHIFDWYGAGDVRFDWPGNDMVSHVTPAGAAYLRELVDQTGALVVGRRIFDLTDGWAGRHPIGVPVFVVSHRGPEGWDERHDPSRTTFVHDGLAAAVERARAVAGDKWIGVGGANIAQQCLDLGLLDEIRIELAPVVLGSGIPFFANLTTTPLVLDGPRVIEDRRVTHLAYTVRKEAVPEA